MRLVSLVLLGLFFWVNQALAAPRLLLVSPSNIRLGFYGTITGENFSSVPEENQVFVLPDGSSEAVTVPVTKVITVRGSETQQKLTFILTPNVLDTPPRTSVPAEVWVVTNGEASNRLCIKIVPSPAITSVTPATAYPGDEIDVEIETFRTRLRLRGLSLRFGEGIEVQDLTVNGPTSLTAHLRIAEDAPIGKRDVILRQGRLVIKGFQLFEVLPPPQAKRLTLEVQEPPKVVFTPSVTIKGAVNTELGEPEVAPPPAIITSLIPATGQQGQRLTLRLTGQNTHFKALNTQLLLGQGIQVEDLRVLDETHLEATIYIDPEAELGSRVVQVVTEDEIAPCALAFNVTRGFGCLKGYVKDATTLQPLVGVRVALPDYGLSVRTDENGYFELCNIPSGQTRAYFSVVNYQGEFLDVEIVAGKTIDLTKLHAGDEAQAGILLKPLVSSGEIPGATFEAILSQGLTLPIGPTNTKTAKEKIINAVIALGGTEMGVLDDNGQQLNPQVQGDGILSLKTPKVEALADYWQMGESYSLAELLYFITNVFKWENDHKPTLGQWLKVLNQVVADLWKDPENEAYDLVRFIFTVSKKVPNDPPYLTPGYRLNPIQAFFLVQAFFIRYAEEHLHAALPQSNGYLVAAHLGAGSVMISDAFFLLAQNESNDSESSERPQDNQKRPFKALTEFINGAWKKLGAFGMDLADIWASDLVQQIIKEGSPAGSSIVDLILGQKEERIKALTKTEENLVQNLASHYAGKVMQTLWQPLLNMYRITVVQTTTPLPPILEKVDYHRNTLGKIDGLKITFSPSPTEFRIRQLKAQRQGEYPKIFYQIYRLDGEGLHIVTFKEADEFSKDEDGRYYFVDQGAPFGVVHYRVVAIARWRRDPLHVVDFSKDFYYELVKKFAPLPSTMLLFPLMEDLWSTYAELSAYFFLARSPFSNDYAFYNNPLLKSYCRIDVATPPPFGENPDYQALVSVTDEGRIYVLKQNGSLEPWADVYFAPPYQKGLAVDFLGRVYTENAASETKFAGKIFVFVPVGDRGIRLDRSVDREELSKPWLGTIRAWSPFGLSQGFIYPVTMADLCYGFYPELTDHPEGLYILEQSFADIRFLPIDGSRTVASSLHSLDAELPTQFPINEFSRCAYNWRDNNLYFSFADEIKRLDFSSKELSTVVAGHLEGGAQPPRFLQISGFAFDENGLLYLSDFYLQSVFVYLPQRDNALVLYNLNSLQASPVDLALSPDGKSLIVATDKGLLVLPKLVPFEIKSSEDLSLEGILSLQVSPSFEGVTETIQARAHDGILLAPVYKDLRAFWIDDQARVYSLFFQTQTHKVYVYPLNILPSEPSASSVQINTPEEKEFDVSPLFVSFSSEGVPTIGSCIVPHLPDTVPFIRVISPIPSVPVGRDFYLQAVVSPGISKLRILLDYRVYEDLEINPQKGDCVALPFQNISLGRHVLILEAPEKDIKEVLPIEVKETPSQRVLAGVVTGPGDLPLTGLQVENPDTGLKTSVDMYGVFQLVVPEEVEHHLILRVP